MIQYTINTILLAVSCAVVAVTAGTEYLTPYLLSLITLHLISKDSK